MADYDEKSKLLDLTESNLPLEGDEDLQKKWKKKIADSTDDFKQDKSERKNVYRKRHDFYVGNHGDYSNVNGVIKDTKQKKGHINQVTNYAGKTVVKLALGLANNPPHLSSTSEDPVSEIAQARAQGVEDFTDSVFDDKINRFFKSTYRRACFIQSEYGDAAIKTFPLVDQKKIKIVGHDDMGSLMVLWNGNPGEYDGVIAEMYLSPKKIYDSYGIKVDEKLLADYKEKNKDFSESIGGHNDNQYGTKGTKNGKSDLPTGKNSQPTLCVIEYDTDEVYALKIEGELVQLQFKDDVNFPKVKFWTIIPNIPNPPSPWSIADIDYMMDPQIELNDNDNRSADHLRVGNVQRYVAYNMAGFDPESLKTSSGQVIFVNSPDGSSKFEPLPTNINNFPDDQYHNRKMGQIYDMGLPKVNFGASGADSGRSKAIDYQSSVEITTFKRDAWELALADISEKIQIFGNFIHGPSTLADGTEDPGVDWFTNEQGEFIVRNVEFDWTDALPISQSDKIVNIANKVNMIGISLKTALKELGYRNPEAEIAQMRKELADPMLMIFRSKMWNFSEGILQAQMQASMAAQSNGTDAAGGGANQSTPTLTSSQNTGAKPMAAAGGTTSYSSAPGMIDKARQNTQAKG